MLDFSEGWMWFVAGFGASLVAVVCLLAVVWLARRSEQAVSRADQRPRMLS